MTRSTKQTLFISMICISLVTMTAMSAHSKEQRTAKAKKSREISYETIEAFHQAAKNGDKKAVEKLLAQGVNVDIELAQTTPLMKASGAGQAEIVRVLISAGADINKEGYEGTTALMFAAMEGRLETVKLLVEKGANVSAVNKSGHSAGRMASDKTQVEVVKYLSAHGYKPAGVQYARQIEKQYNVSFTGGDFVQAVKSNNKELVLLFIKAGIDMNAPGRAGYLESTAIEETIKAENASMAKLLIENGLDVNKHESHHDTPLMMAAEAGNAEIARLLMKAGAEVNARDHRGNTALHEAVNAKDPEIVRLLIEAGADMYAMSEGDNTNMNNALHNKSEEIVRILVEKGYDMSRNSEDADLVKALAQYKTTATSPGSEQRANAKATDAKSAQPYADPSKAERAQDYFQPEGMIKILEVTMTTEKGETHRDQRLVIGAKTEYRGKTAIPVNYAVMEKGQEPKEFTKYIALNMDSQENVGMKSTTTSGTTEIYYDPPVKQFQLPLKSGLSWEENFTVMNLINGEERKGLSPSATFTINGQETVDTAAGKFECWKVGQVGSGKNGVMKSTETSWYAKNVGLVKYTSESPKMKVLTILKSYSSK